MIKATLLLALLVIGCSAFSQKSNNKFVWPKPIRDSVWHEVACDTLFGTIEIKVGNSKIVGDGIITDCIHWEYHKDIYSAKGQAKIDSFYKKQRDDIEKGATSGLDFGIGETGMGSPMRKAAFLKTKDGYKQIYDQYTFTPTIK